MRHIVALGVAIGTAFPVMLIAPRDAAASCRPSDHRRARQHVERANKTLRKGDQALVSNVTKARAHYQRAQSSLARAETILRMLRRDCRSAKNRRIAAKGLREVRRWLADARRLLRCNLNQYHRLYRTDVTLSRELRTYQGFNPMTQVRTKRMQKRLKQLERIHAALPRLREQWRRFASQCRAPHLRKQARKQAAAVPGKLRKVTSEMRAIRSRPFSIHKGGQRKLILTLHAFQILNSAPPQRGRLSRQRARRMLRGQVPPILAACARRSKTTVGHARVRALLRASGHLQLVRVVDPGKPSAYIKCARERLEKQRVPGNAVAAYLALSVR